MKGDFNNRLLFPLLFSGHFCWGGGGGQGLDGGVQSRDVDPPVSPLGKTLHCKNF